MHCPEDRCCTADNFDEDHSADASSPHPARLVGWFASKAKPEEFNARRLGYMAMYKSILVLVALFLTETPPPVVAQPLAKCTVGQQVTDSEGKTGVIVSGEKNLCQVKYADGLIYGWIYWNLHPANDANPSLSGWLSGPPSPDPPSKNPVGSLPLLLRPTQNNLLSYRADSRGQVTLEAKVNGVPIRFLVDTGASLVFLSAKDARAIGFSPSGLAFNKRAQTANGPVDVAPVLLREVRIGQLAIDAVPAAVIANLEVSVLGMSFLQRLKGFAMQNGTLTIQW
jgi:clan AA aspartic protease (TIGR02281 family)